MTIVADENAIHVLCSRCNRRAIITRGDIPDESDRFDYAIGSLKESGWIYHQHSFYCPDCAMIEGYSVTATDIAVEDGDVWVKLNISADELADKLISGWERKTFKVKEE